MTIDHEDLIAEARTRTYTPSRPSLLIDHLADALESTTARLREAEACIERAKFAFEHPRDPRAVALEMSLVLATYKPTTENAATEAARDRGKRGGDGMSSRNAHEHPEEVTEVTEVYLDGKWQPATDLKPGVIYVLRTHRTVQAIREAAPGDAEREAEQQTLCWECIENPDPNRENESSGYCPTLCENCGGCAYCDGSC